MIQGFFFKCLIGGCLVAGVHCTIITNIHLHWIFSPKQHCPIILGCISPRVPVSYGPLVATEVPGHSPELIKGFATLLRLCRELGRVLKDRHFTDVYACTLLCPRSRFLPLKFFFPIFDDDPFKPPNLDQPCLFLARNSRLLRKQISRFFQ